MLNVIPGDVFPRNIRYQFTDKRGQLPHHSAISGQLVYCAATERRWTGRAYVSQADGMLPDVVLNAVRHCLPDIWYYACSGRQQFTMNKYCCYAIFGSSTETVFFFVFNYKYIIYVYKASLRTMANGLFCIISLVFFSCLN